MVMPPLCVWSAEAASGSSSTAMSASGTAPRQYGSSASTRRNISPMTWYAPRSRVPRGCNWSPTFTTPPAAKIVAAS